MTHSDNTSLIIRPARSSDMDAITAIYAREVLEGIATFEYAAPDAAEMERRFLERTGAGYPWLTAEYEGDVAGYAYAGAVHARPGYRFTAEDTIYLARDFQRRGIGRALLERLISECETLGFRQMISLIGDSANTGSIRLHRACGFEDAGVWKSVGWKFDRWIDVVVMQRTLGEGDTSPASTAMHSPR